MTKHKRIPVTLCTEIWAGTCDSLLRLNIRREEPRDREPSMELISRGCGRKVENYIRRIEIEKLEMESS